jgi:hypothetical protein
MISLQLLKDSHTDAVVFTAALFSSNKCMPSWSWDSLFCVLERQIVWEYKLNDELLPELEKNAIWR